MNQKVSIIIPIYNAQKYLKECLDSILHQTYQNLEIVCINDGSKDNSLDILETYQTNYPDLFKIKTIENGGQANARNVGMDLSTGDYIMFVDSDDVIEEDMVENMLQKSKDCDMVVCNIDRIFDGKFDAFQKNFSYDTTFNIQGITTIQEHPEIICFITGAPYAKLLNRQFMNDNDIRFVKGYIYEDQMFTQKILSSNPTIAFDNRAYYKYFVRSGTTMTSKTSRVSDMFFAYETLYNYYKEKGLEKQYKEELDFLCLYHVMIGTSFRLFKSGQANVFKAISTCRQFIRKYNCKKNNKYIKEKGFVSTLFIKLFA